MGILTILLPSNVHPTTEELRNLLASIKLDDAHRIIAIVARTQLRLEGRNPHRADRFYQQCVFTLAEKPQRKIDIVDAAIDENPPGGGGLPDQSPGFRSRRRRVQLVARLRAKHTRVADHPRADLCVCIAIRGVEAAREAAEDFLRGILLERAVVGVEDGFTLSVS